MMTVWIVEDKAADARAAWDAIRKAAEALNLAPHIYWNDTLQWPPAMRNLTSRFSTDFELEGLGEDYPDIVILDLLLGDQPMREVFDGLRKWEHARGSHRSFVIIWSANLTNAAAAAIAADIQKQDRTRCLQIDIKRTVLLRHKIIECWRTLVDERLT